MGYADFFFELNLLPPYSLHSQGDKNKWNAKNYLLYQYLKYSRLRWNCNTKFTILRRLSNWFLIASEPTLLPLQSSRFFGSKFFFYFQPLVCLSSLLFYLLSFSSNPCVPICLLLFSSLLLAIYYHYFVSLSNPFFIKILNLYIIILCTHLYRTSFQYLSITCNAFIACYIRCNKYVIGINQE